MHSDVEKRVRAVKGLLRGEPIRAVAKRAKVDTVTLRTWRREYEDGGRAQLAGVTLREIEGTAQHHFISYSRRDQRISQPIFDELRARGVLLWVDELSLRGGVVWRKEIDLAIRSSKTLVLLLSEHSIRSREVLREVDVALEAGVDVIPARIRAVTIPPSIMKRIGDRHIISMTQYRRERTGLLLEAMAQDDAPTLPPFQETIWRSNVKRVADSIRFTRDVLRDHDAVILKACNDRDDNSYVQFLAIATKPEDPLYAEAVGDRNREPEHALSDDQKAALTRLGWKDPKKDSAGNHWREWMCTLEPELRTVAAIAVRTLMEVYGHLAGEEVGIELV